MLMAAVVRELIAAGLEGDALVAALERIEQSTPATRTARQERNARYYEKRLKASEIKTPEPASESVLKASESVLNSDAPTPTREPPKGVSLRRGQLPEDFSLDEALEIAMASKLLSRDRAKAEFLKFRDHARATGRVMRDWRAAWRMWCRKAIEFSPDTNGGGRGPKPNFSIGLVK
jgi:hypothetical protein